MAYLNPRQASRYSVYLLRWMECRVDFGVWLYSEIVYPFVDSGVRICVCFLFPGFVPATELAKSDET